LVETCFDTVDSALAAARGGAGRLELCASLCDAGTTPSAGMIAAVKARVAIPVFVLVRPRGGGFVYSDREFDVMRRDIDVARQFGGDGIVLGALGESGRVDVKRTLELVTADDDLPVTFHRAFDCTPTSDRRSRHSSFAACGGYSRRVVQPRSRESKASQRSSSAPPQEFM
jgi:copper homeostasis protein